MKPSFLSSLTNEQLGGHRLSRRDGYDEYRCVGCKTVFGGPLVMLLGSTITRIDPSCEEVQRTKNAANS